MPADQRPTRPSSAVWRDGLLASVRRAAEGGAGPESAEETSSCEPQRVEAVGELGPGWFAVDDLGDVAFDLLEDARLIDPENPDSPGYRVLDVRVVTGRTHLRVHPGAPERGLALVLSRPNPASRHRGLLQTLSDSRSVKAVQPFTRGVLDRLPRIDHTLTGRARAVAAASAPGLQIVWGPPATGKTAVIAEALGDALDRDQRVLLTSVNPRAVDQALERLIRQRPRDAARVVRVGPTTSAELGERDDVQLTRLVRARQQPLTGAIEEAERRIVALDHATALTELADARRRLTGFDPDDHQRRRARLDDADALAEVTERLRRERDHEATADTAAAHLADETRAVAIAVQRSLTDHFTVAGDEARRERQSLGGGLRGLGRRRVLNRAAAQADVAAAEHRRRLGALQTRTGPVTEIPDGDHSSLPADLADQAARLTERRRDSVADRAELSERISGAESERERLSERPVPEPADAEVTARSAEAGLPELAESLPRLVAAADQIHEDRERAAAELTRLLDEAQAGRSAVVARVLGASAITATTVRQLAGQPQLAGRRYDLVIIDDAVAAPLPDVVAAAARADRSCLLLGDYFQVGSAEPGRNDQEPDYYTRTDVFEHFGLVSARAAQHNPGCVVLDRQDRFGPGIVEYANRIAYQGVLGMSPKPNRAAPDTELIFVDLDGLPSGLTSVTTDQPDRTVEAEQRSWPAGARIAAGLAAYQLAQGRSVGVLTPYRAQRSMIIDQLTEAGLRPGPKLHVGLVEEFLGRCYDVIIFDTVEDGTGRIADAHRDARGPDRERRLDGLRSVGVAITRATEQVCLIGSGRAMRGGPGTPFAELAAMIADGTVRRISAAQAYARSVTDEPSADGEFAALHTALAARQSEG